MLVAKLAMVELAGGMGYNNPDASFTGPGRTPWNPDHWSGGSSSGSGAATAAGLVAFAIGSETSGSILTPASFCGLSALRPTYGLVSRHGAMALCWTLDKLGPLCRTADDCGLVLQAIAGPDPKDPTTEGRFALDAAGVHAALPHRRARRTRPHARSRRCATNFEKSLEALRGFATLDMDVPFPDFPWGPAVGLIVDAEGAAAFRELIESGGTRKLRAQSDRYGGYVSMMTLAVDYLEAMRARVPMRAALDALLAKYDALVCPTRAVGRAAHRLRLRQAAGAGPASARGDAVRAGHHPRREPGGRASGLRAERLRRERPADLAPAHRSRVLRRDAALDRRPLPAGDRLAHATAEGGRLAGGSRGANLSSEA